MMNFANAKQKSWGQNFINPSDTPPKKTFQFPDPSHADEDGIVAVGGQLDVSTLTEAYRRGIFPWPLPQYPKEFPFMTWFSPDPRGVLDFDDLHIPRSLHKLIKRNHFTYSIDRAFSVVIKCCKNVARTKERGTWINDDIVRAYMELHRKGVAHSVEVWQGEDLVAGLYGVDAGGAFGGESMFTLVNNGSKLALIYLVDHLKKRGTTWIDIQMVTPHLEALGGKPIRREVFLKRLRETQSLGLHLF